MPSTAVPNIAAVIAGQARLTPAQALRLYHDASLPDLGQWATAMAERLHAQRGAAGIRTYVIDRNINYTNVCSANCTFCAFKRDVGGPDAYVLSTAELHRKVAELVAIGGTQVLLQGGMHPDLPLEFYEDMLRGLKAAFPQVHLHGFSPPEFVEFVAVFDLPGFPRTAPGDSAALPWDTWCAKLEAILRRLKSAGLDSIPGGGGEIFAEAVRRRIGPGKCSAAQWLEVMAAAHRAGMFTSATMMFGHIEGVADRIDHLVRVRAAQDRALAAGWPGRYVSFIAWPFQRENTPLGRLPEWDLEGATDKPGPPGLSVETFGRPGSPLTSSEDFACQCHPAAPFPGDVLADLIHAGQVDPLDKAACTAAVPLAGKRLRRAGAADYLRMQAIARLFLDNLPSIGASWVTMGPKIGQLGLFYGASDLGSVMMEENVVSAAGTTYRLTEAVLCHLIRTAGFTPAQRDNRYRLLKVHDGRDPASAPDLRVTDWATQRASPARAAASPEPAIGAAAAPAEPPGA